MAEGEGFEPSERGYRSTVFKTAAFDHSATPPHEQQLYPTTYRRAWREGVLRMRAQEDEFYMRMALDEACAAAAKGEVPIGAVVVYEAAHDPVGDAYISPEDPKSAWEQAPHPRVLARAHNRRELDKDPSAHAEHLAMVAAARALGHWRLAGCTVYVTLEPCLMCAGLMVNARIDCCVYGAADPKGGALGSLYDLSRDGRLNHSFTSRSGVLADEAARQLRDFFRGRRAQSAPGTPRGA